MKPNRKMYLSLSGVVLFMIAIFLMSFRLNDDPEILKAGVSKVKITPEKPVRMSGYAARTEPFKGVHDDLYARAVVFESSSSKACIITSEVIGFSNEFIDETRKRNGHTCQ